MIRLTIKKDHSRELIGDPVDQLVSCFSSLEKR